MDTHWASLIFLASRQFWVLSQSLCRPDETLEVVKEKANNSFTCTYSPASILIWSVRATSNSDVTVNLFCEINNNECTVDGYPEIFSAKMMATNSVINVNTVSMNPEDSFLFERGTLTCVTKNISIDPGQKSECHLDYVYPAEGTCTIQFSSQTWAVTVHCIITKASSARNRYYCEWYLMHSSLEPMLVNTTFMNVSGNGAYVSGTCSFNESLPETEGQYKYNVILYPGKNNVSAIFNGSNEIRKPLGPVSHNCTHFILEGQDLDCTCFTNDLGSPPGWLQWTNAGSARLILKNLTEKDSGKIYKCQMIWKNNAFNFTTFIINVVYGPRDVVISANETIPFDTNGTRDITLLCNVSRTNPKPQITWSWSSNISAKYNGDTLTYKPNPPEDDGANIRCIAINEITNKGVTANVSVSLNYPPTSPPSIVNYSDNDIVYSGDFLKMTCIVKGGLPSNATKVNFSCSGKPDENDIFGNDGVNSTITFTQVNEYDHGRVCNCTAKWKNYTWYTLSAQRILNVYYPPQRPNITERNKQTFPYLEGEYVSLSCDLIVKGNPPANLSWSFYRNANISRTNDTSVQLELQPLVKNDNNKTVTCSAENNFTQIKGSTDMGVFVLQVYYRPILELRQGEDNSCIFTSELWQCAVTEGRRIDIQCMADSNPVSGNITWHNANWTSVTFTNSSQLYIPSANKSEHNGIFTCRAVTTKPNISDTRLPLSSTKDLYVLVKYMPCAINLTFDKTATNITVMEKEIVTFVCRSNGRPTPTVILFNQDNSTQLFRIQGGVLNLADEITTLNYTISHVSCEDTGNYACSGENDVGKLHSNNTSLRVNCKPRYANDVNQNYNTTINYVGFSEQTTIELIAFPVPEKLTVIGPVKNLTSSEGTVSTNIFSMTCWTTYALYAVSCNITLDNITSDSQAGYYRAFISNSFGNETLVIRVKVNETGGMELKTYTSSLNIAVIGGGVGAFVAFIIFIFVAVLIAKKRYNVKKQDKSRVKCIQNALEGENDAGTIIQNDLYGDITGNVDNKELWSKNLIKEQATVYENVTFQGNQDNDTCQTYYKPEEVSRNEDGLVYTTVDFSEILSKKAEMDLPKQERTEYATIVVNKTSVAI